MKEPDVETADVPSPSGSLKSMQHQGPPLESLTHRLSECPPDFLAEPRLSSQSAGQSVVIGNQGVLIGKHDVVVGNAGIVTGSQGIVHTAAVVSDLMRELGGAQLTTEHVAALNNNDRNRLRLTLIACWLLYDEWFRARREYSTPALQFLLHGLAELAFLVDAPQFVSDPDRREELARVCLSALNLRPAGETIAQAQDRLTTLDTRARHRVLLETRAAQLRAQAIREEMQRKAAEAAAASYSRE